MKQKIGIRRLQKKINQINKVKNKKRNLVKKRIQHIQVKGYNRNDLIIEQKDADILLEKMENTFIYVRMTLKILKCFCRKNRTYSLIYRLVYRIIVYGKFFISN